MTEEFRIANLYQDGATASFTGSQAFFNIALNKGVDNRIVREVRISAPGIIGDVVANCYDGSAGVGSAITGGLYLATQPDDGFKIMQGVTTGSLGIVLNGRTSGQTKAFVWVKYSYQ